MLGYAACLFVGALIAQTDPVPGSWLNYVQRAGLLGAVLLFAWLLYSRRLITRDEHLERLAEERAYTAEWKALAQGAIERIDTAVQAMRDRA